MLKTNSKQARTNLHSYIMDSWNIEPEDQGRSWAETKEDIILSFIDAAYLTEWQRKQNRQDAFKSWLSGLPRGLGDFFLWQAVEDLGDILEESQTEREQYTQSQAEEKLSYLIYREVYYG